MMPVSGLVAITKLKRNSGATHVVMYGTLASSTKCFNGKGLSFFHLSLVLAFDDGHALSTVNLPLTDIVASQVSDRLDGVRLAIEFDLVALHDFLDGCSDVSDADIDTSLLS